MLPAPPSRRPRLADVLPSCLAAVSGGDSALKLPPVRKAVVLLVDGLGHKALTARAGHARTLASALSAGAKLHTTFPSTTASALATLSTGRMPGEHGLVGYSVFDRSADRVVNQLTGWDERMPPETWQLEETVFERAALVDIPSIAIGHPRFAGSGFTRAVLRGAAYRAGATLQERFATARQALDEHGRCLVYVYAAELDKIAHRDGWESIAWTRMLESLDSALASFVAGLRPGEGLLVTADHGVLDVPAGAHVLVDEVPGLMEGVRQVAGEPRCLQLRLEDEAGLDAVLARWRAAEAHRAWVLGRDEAIASGWLGDRVRPEARDRLGDILVIARSRIAYYDSRSASEQALAMVAQHGALSPEEVVVPLLRFGGFAQGA